MMDTSRIKKILVISLTNIGDVILTFPVIDILKQDFPDARVSVVIGPKGASLLEGNGHIDQAYIFHKRQSLPELFSWLGRLRRERFDLVVDLRNTAIPFVINAREKTSPFMRREKGHHMRRQHLNRLRSVYPYPREAGQRCALSILEEDKKYIDEVLRPYPGPNGSFIVVSPGAADRAKRWTEEGFTRLCDHIIAEYQTAVVFVGAQDDRPVVERIVRGMRSPGLDLCGKTTLRQLAELLRRCRLAIVNDSAPMHLASYLDVPVLALFGPTDPRRYGPWGTRARFIAKNGACPACQRRDNTSPHSCMKAITVQDVLEAFELTAAGVKFHGDNGA